MLWWREDQSDQSDLLRTSRSESFISWSRQLYNSIASLDISINFYVSQLQSHPDFSRLINVTLIPTGNTVHGIFSWHFFFIYLKKDYSFSSFASFPRNFSLPKSSHLVTGLPNVILPAVSGLKVSSTPPRVRFLTIYVKMLIGQLVLFVNEAFCINQLTVGPGQELLRTAMEISSKMSSKPRKSWIWKLMVKL